MDTVQSAAPAFLQQVVAPHASSALTFRTFGVVTKLHANAATGEVYGGLCTLEPRRNGPRVTIAFNSASFAHGARPLHAGPVELPCSAAADVKLGTVLYGVAARGAGDGMCTFRACTEGAALLALVKLLHSDRKDADAVWAARAALQLSRAPDRADELVLLGLVLVGDLLAIVRLAEAAGAGASESPHPTAVLLTVGEQWRRAPDEFVRCAALISSAPILLHRLDHFVLSRCERTVPPAMQRRLRASARALTSKNVSLYRHACEQKFAALGEGGGAVAERADKGNGGGAASDSEEEWSC